MGKPYSDDLRKRVVAAVETGGLSCNRAAKQFGVAVSTAVGWVRRSSDNRRRTEITASWRQIATSPIRHRRR